MSGTCHQTELVPGYVGPHPLLQLGLENLNIPDLSDLHWDPIVSLGAPAVEALVQ